MRGGHGWRYLPWRLRYLVLGRWASTWRRWMIKATHLHAEVVFEGPVYLGPGFGLRMNGKGSLRIGAGTEFRRNFVCEIAEGGSLSIGPRCVFTGMGLIQCSTSVEIGAAAIMGQGVLVADGNHRFRDPDVPFLEQGYKFRPIRIGEGAVILTNCIVTNDVGRRAVVAANSVVTSPVPEYSLARGNPADVVEYFGSSK